MSPTKGEPTETSPLLAKPNNGTRTAEQTIEPSAGIAPEGLHTDGTEEHEQNGSAEDDGGDIERTLSANAHAKQHGGLPEVRSRFAYILPALAIGIFLSAADQTIIVSSYGSIGTDLHALSSTSWIATAYFLTLTSFQPLYGKLSDIFGRKACLLFAYAVFGTGCLLCGLARNIGELIAARAFAGIGGGAMTTVVSILLSDVVTLRERGKWQGYLNIVYATGASCGAPLGGILSDGVGWRWAFIAQAPMCALAFVSVGFTLKLPQKEAEGRWKDKLKRIDFLGAALLIAAVSTLLVGLDRGSNVAWSDKVTIATLSVSIPLFVVFCLIEIYVASEPFAPGHIIFERSHLAAYLCNFFSFCGWLSALFYIPLYFQAVHGLSATQAGLRLVPSILFGVLGSLSGGIYMQKTGKYYWITVGCYCSLTIGLLIIVLFSGVVATSTVGMIVGMCVCAFSNGIGVTTALIALIANADHSDQAVVTACSYLFRSLGSVFGISLSATIANQVLRTTLRSELSSGKDALEIAERVRESLSYIKTLKPATAGIVRDCYARSTRAAFALEVCLVFGAALAALWIKEKPLSK